MYGRGAWLCYVHQSREGRELFCEVRGIGVLFGPGEVEEDTFLSGERREFIFE